MLKLVKCPKCGEELAEDDKLCPVCGYEISKSNEKPSSSTDGKSYNKIIAVVAIIVIIAIVGVLASGMFSSDDSSVSKNTESVDSVKDDSSSSNDESGGTEYWASEKTSKFHLPTCEWAEKISENNKIIYDSREDAIADGKEPCDVCNP